VSTIHIQKNNIVGIRADAIVNAANNHLAHGGGVCGAIFSAAGPEQLSEACKAIGHCPVGCAVITPAFDLEETNGVKYIIHAVGPDYRRKPVDPEATLYSCYIAALKLAMENGCHSIAFPLISAGIYECPLHTAWDRSLAACHDFISSHPEYELDILFVSTSQVNVDYGNYLLSDYDTFVQADPISYREQNNTVEFIPEDSRDSARLFLQNLLDATDPEEYPETTVFLARVLNEIDQLTADSIDNLIRDVILCDCTRPLPEHIATLVKEHLKSSDDKDGYATLALGLLYYNGRIGKQDFARATDYYLRSAANGNLIAVQNLGYCYYYGRSIPVDFDKAYHCFVKCALTGDLISLYKIGDMYRYGYYVEKDPQEAYRIYEQCDRSVTEENADFCAANIASRMGDCLFEGIGCERDLEKALEYYQKSELLYYRRMEYGDYMVKESLEKVLRAEQQCRMEIMKRLPEFDWIKFEY